MSFLPASIEVRGLSFKKDVRLDDAREIARDFVSRTKDLYKRYLLAGSVRRKKPIVHDIDIAVIPRGKAFGQWKDKVIKRVAEIGGRVTSFGDTISNFVYRGVQINLFICLNEDAWGVTQMWATGPKGHTIGMTIKARDRGLIINSKGLWTRDEPPKLIKTKTEKDVGRLLEWKYKSPEERGLGEKRGKIFEL
jgi:DNA polymerase/3'-5' exonuclease PolX